MHRWRDETVGVIGVWARWYGGPTEGIGWGVYLAHSGDAKAYTPSTLYTRSSHLISFVWDYVIVLQVTWQPEMR